MIPSPDGSTRRSGSRVTVADYARELDALVLMGGSDVCPATYGETRAAPAVERRPRPRRLRDRAAARVRRDGQAGARPVPRRAGDQRRDGRHALPGHPDAASGRAAPSHAVALREELPRDVDRRRAAASRGSIPALSLVKTNSVHHQAVKDLGRDLVVEAWSEPDRVRRSHPLDRAVVPLRRAMAPEFHPPGDDDASSTTRRSSTISWRPRRATSPRPTPSENVQRHEDHRIPPPAACCSTSSPTTPRPCARSTRARARRSPNGRPCR